MRRRERDEGRERASFTGCGAERAAQVIKKVAKQESEPEVLQQPTVAAKAFVPTFPRGRPLSHK